MIIPCEMSAKAIVPTIRAMVAKELNFSYGMKQDNIATVLGITQSAVSQYLANVRGKALNLDGISEVEVLVKSLTQTLSTGNSNPKFVLQKYCEICKIVREKRILCQLHQRLDSSVNIANCDICVPTSTICP